MAFHSCLSLRDLYRATPAVTWGGILSCHACCDSGRDFIVPRLLWLGEGFYRAMPAVTRGGILSCYACCDTGRDLYRAMPAVAQAGVFIVPHLLWYRDGSFSCHTCCETGRDLYHVTPVVTQEGGGCLYRATSAVTQGGVFIVPHLLWYREGSLSWYTCCETGKDLYCATPVVTRGLSFLWPYLKDRPILSPFTTSNKQGV
jgi:hypothetical protein